jgi:hypothetical protein
LILLFFVLKEDIMAIDLKIYVNEVPECVDWEAEEAICPFAVKDTNKAYLEEPTFRCSLRGTIVTAQYGGQDISEMEKRPCPLEQLPCLTPEAEGVKCPTCDCPKCGGAAGKGSRSHRSSHH